MARYRSAQLRQFRLISDCERCVHYAQGCPLFLAILLANEEDLTASPLDQFVDVASPCPMFFAASEKAPLFPTCRFLRGVEKFEAPNKQV
jgi:hypothetical protein